MTSAPITIDTAQELIDSLYDCGDLSHDQVDSIYAILEMARGLQRSHHEAWVLIGKLDFFLETSEAQPIRARRTIAARLRREIKEASGQ